ncbi:DUF3072 domain-containing protein [Bradyrhizobium sp. ARR65]|uniref:DUF3072 domain-containing protein n=1 Tax=Bradyrhizobium sp. ARR65 TaxID=1040989 RepID=UPI0032DFDDD6
MGSKTNPSVQKHPDDWISGDEPMTDAQASYLETLSEQAHQPFQFRKDLSKAEAFKLIDTMREKAGVTDYEVQGAANEPVETPSQKHQRSGSRFESGGTKADDLDLFHGEGGSVGPATRPPELGRDD